MPWSEPNPFTGACRWIPTEQEMQKDALDLYSWLVTARVPHTYGELARAIREHFDTESNSLAARRNRAFAEALEREPERCFLRPQW